jgi:hypothetical protein
MANSSGPNALALDVNNVYFTTNDSIYRVDKGGAATSLIAAGVPLSGATLPSPPVPPLSNARFFGLAVDSTQHGYVTVSSNVVTVASVALTAMNAVSPFAGPCGSGIPGCQPYAITADSTNVYWTLYVTGGKSVVLEAPIAGGAATLVASGLGFPAGIAVDTTNVYWTDNFAGTVMKAPLAGGTPTVIASGTFGQNFPFGIAVDQSNVYWTDLAGTVMKAPISGGVVTTIASGQNLPLAIAVDQTSVYWTNNGDGTVVKANK